MTTDFKAIKKRIFEEDKIEQILESLGCDYIRHENGKIVASLPDGDNKRSVQVKLSEELYSNIRSKGIKGDIFAIVSYIEFNCINQSEIDGNLHEAKMWVVDELGYHDLLKKGKDKGKEDHNKWLKDLKKKKKKIFDPSAIKPNNPIPESVKNSYLMLPYIPWINEGISWSTQMEWEIGFDWESKRIVTLIRNSIGQLIGVKGRALDDNNPWKYLYVEEMNKSIELFGLHKTLPYILEQNEIIIFEGYKSVFKAWQMGIRNVASMEGDDLSPAQIGLIKSLGLNIKVVLCYDKDKSKEEIEEQARKITNRKVYYTLDNGKRQLLSGKDSVVDRGKRVFERLLENKIEFTP